MSIDTNINVEIDRVLPDAESDSTEKTWRGGRYGEGYMIQTGGNNFHMMADEGTYKVAMGTPGTGIAFTINTGMSETAGNVLYVKNNDAVNNSRAKCLYPHYIRMICTVVPAAATAMHAMVKIDNRDRYTSGGTQLTVNNPNIGIGAGTQSQIFAGALTTVAPSPSAYPVARAVMKTAIPVVNDEWLFLFGSSDGGGSSIALGGAVAQRMVIPCPPVILPPQSNMCLQMWCPTNAVTAPSFEFEVGFFER